LGVTRWLAERADVVLLFFDPDKVRTHRKAVALKLNRVTLRR
jgi:hypothetical protein